MAITDSDLITEDTAPEPVPQQDSEQAVPATGYPADTWG